jgi:hypothetical protein
MTMPRKQGCGGPFEALGDRTGVRSCAGMYLPPLLEELGPAELSHDAGSNQILSIREQGNT